MAKILMISDFWYPLIYRDTVLAGDTQPLVMAVTK